MGVVACTIGGDARRSTLKAEKTKLGSWALAELGPLRGCESARENVGAFREFRLWPVSFSGAITASSVCECGECVCAWWAWVLSSGGVVWCGVVWVCLAGWLLLRFTIGRSTWSWDWRVCCHCHCCWWSRMSLFGGRRAHRRPWGWPLRRSRWRLSPFRRSCGTTFRRSGSRRCSGHSWHWNHGGRWPHGPRTAETRWWWFGWRWCRSTACSRRWRTFSGLKYWRGEFSHENW